MSDMVSADALQDLTRRLHALNDKALLLPARYGNIPFAELDAWADAFREGRLPSHAPQIMRMGEQGVTHVEEGYQARSLHPDGPISRNALAALLRDAGPGLRRAKGILAIEGEGVCIVQYAAGRLELTPAPDETTTDLVLIGIPKAEADL